MYYSQITAEKNGSDMTQCVFSSLQLPMIRMLVSGKGEEFLVDLGATHFVLKASDWLDSPKLSSRTADTTGAGGIPVTVHLLW